VRKKEKKIQVALLITGVFLILLTYFYYPYMNKNKSVVKKEIQKKFPDTFNNTNENATLFENLEYQGLYDLDKKFLVKSKKAHINPDEPDVVIMKNMHVIFYLKDGRVVNIFSDKGKYNKSNYDCFFEKNVKATDGEIKIFSDNLDLLGKESSVKIYNNVSINYPTGSLVRADKIDYDFEKKHFKISMFEDKRVKMKIFK
jgi:lipopolysaccharide assembly outer membrane protein LptD (OstA)